MQANSECNYNDNNYEALTLHLESVSCRVRGNLILVLQEAAALVMMTTQLRFPMLNCIVLFFTRVQGNRIKFYRVIIEKTMIGYFSRNLQQCWVEDGKCLEVNMKENYDDYYSVRKY